ncbi:ABC transporter permease [Pseudanabaena sp. FACHB-1277]|uniref:ABC transporter permease n=1 Tax=Pseudanabaena cinerea FACHB-1277 TaxID=2949581 RepID=A0A926Z592_9CYAN|nr:ABC transporter permease [Pseudanabaena cinerea]MBD2149495.1 ABC transporter permease [Pseudanabaena cinerea FACHB-1277]
MTTNQQPNSGQPSPNFPVNIPPNSPQKTSWGRWLINDWTMFVLKRLGQSVVVILGVSILSFFAITKSPGNCFAELRNNPSTPKQTIAQLEKQLNYDKPEVVQYLLWLQNTLSGNLGVRCQGLAPVTPLIVERAGNTLIMSIASLLTTWLIAIPLGVYSAVKQNTWSDRLIQIVSYGTQGFPSFVLAILLLMLAQNTGWFPVGGMTSIDFAELSPLGQFFDISRHLILPTLTLTLVSFAGLQRIMRGSLLDVLRQDYIKTARAKGLPESQVIYVHALRNAINPLVTLLGFEFGGLLGGAFVTEFFFNWPGLGKLLLDATREKDTNLVMAGLMLGTVMLVIGNLIGDILLKAVDPRIKLDDME